MSHYKGPRSKVTVRLPKILADRVARTARARGVSINDLAVEMFTREADRQTSRLPSRPSPTMTRYDPPISAVLLDVAAERSVGAVDVLGRDGVTYLVRRTDRRPPIDPTWVSHRRLLLERNPDVGPTERACLIHLTWVAMDRDAVFSPGIKPVTGSWAYRVFEPDGRPKVGGATHGPERARALDGAVRAAAAHGFTHYRLLNGDGALFEVGPAGSSRPDLPASPVPVPPQ